MKWQIRIPGVRTIFRFGWGCYKTAAIVVFSLLILFYLPLVVDRNFSYVRLPNGIKLYQSFIYGTGGNDFVMHNENGNFILRAKGGHVAWRGDYVFGMGFITAGDEQGDEFIYKRGWEEPIIYNYSSRIDYFKKYDLQGWVDYPPEIFHSEAHQECLKFHSMNDCKSRTLNQYWWDVEDGKREPYKCKRNAPKETCHTYGLYKTYLSLIKMPRYKRNWYE